MAPASASPHGPYADVLAGQHAFLVDCVAWAARDLGLVRHAPATTSREHTLRVVLDLLGWPEPTGPHPPAEGFGRLAAVIRDDRPLVEPLGMADPAFQAYLLRLGDGPARALWAALDLPPGRLVDLGGGWGAYARAWCDRVAGGAVVVDFPEVVEGIDDPRIERVGGRIEGCAVEGDVALLANVLHNVGEAEGRSLLAAAARVAPVVVVEDFDRHPVDPTRPPLAAWFALDMALYTLDGDVYPPERIAGWMGDLGLRAHIVRLPAHRAAVVGRRG